MANKEQQQQQHHGKKRALDGSQGHEQLDHDLAATSHPLREASQRHQLSLSVSQDPLLEQQQQQQQQREQTAEGYATPNKKMKLNEEKKEGEKSSKGVEHQQLLTSQQLQQQPHQLISQTPQQQQQQQQAKQPHEQRNRIRKEDRLLAQSYGVRCLPNEEEETLPIRPNFGPKHFRILLVRHAQSVANMDHSVLTRLADHVIDISEVGREQARQVGRQIRDFYTKLWQKEKRGHVRLWTSPYKRARETTKGILEVAGDTISDSKEHIFLGEQQFGLFEGVPLQELSTKYPQEYSHFQKNIRYGGRFWARMPLGESRFDVCRRVNDVFSTFYQDYENYDIRDLVIVTHGVTLRAFVMMWNHQTPEWFEEEPNPNNCCLRFIDGHKDHGYLFPGFNENETNLMAQQLSSTTLQSFEDRAMRTDSTRVQNIHTEKKPDDEEDEETKHSKTGGVLEKMMAEK